jgi:flagellar motor protein MotB
MSSIGVDGPHNHGRRNLRLLTLALLALTGLGMVGCDGNKDQTIAMLQAENQEYMEANEQLKRELATAMEQRAQLVEQNHELVNENAQLRQQLAQAEQAPADPFGGIEGVQGSTRAGEVVAQVQGDVLFASGSVTLRAEAKQTLDQIAQVLNSQFSGNRLRIAGHTDSDPIRKSKWETNLRLSCERAMAVHDYLESRGVDEDRMYVAGYGMMQQLGSKAASRRVEIVVLQQ